LGGGEQAVLRNLQEKVKDSLKESFRPEFLNRIDEIIIFNYLQKPEIKKIVDLELRKVDKRLQPKGITIKVSQAAKDLLAEKGFDPNLGARPLKRVIQKLVLDPLALKIVTGQIQDKDRVIIDVEENKIVFRSPGDLIKMNRQKEMTHA